MGRSQEIRQAECWWGGSLTSWFVSTVDPVGLGLGLCQFPHPMPSVRIQAGAKTRVVRHQYWGRQSQGTAQHSLFCSQS